MKKILVLLSFAIALFSSEGKMQVFKPLTSTCPHSWYEEMNLVAKDVEIVTLRSVKAIKKDVGVPREIQSCNTSFLNDYVFEGNVPSQAIKDFLAKPVKNAIGLALPAYENDKNPKTVFVIFENKTYKEYGKY